MNFSSINIAIIGLGRMGARHIEVAQKMGMNICGLVDISATNLVETAKKYNIPPNHCFDNVNDLFQKNNPDAVVIATTAPSHAEYTILSAQHHVKYILCEKPMALSLDEAHAMIDACSHFDAKLAINHQMMFLPQYIEIKNIINSNKFGHLSSILVAGSNFGLAMNVCHYFEMFRFLTNSDISTIQSWLEDEKIPNPRGDQFEDFSGSLIAKNADGIRMYIDFSANSGHGLQVTYIFKYGQIIVDELSGFIRTICRKDEFKELPTTRYGMPAEINQYEIVPVELIDSTVKVWDAMITNSYFPDFKAGLHALNCMMATIESSSKVNSIIKINNLTIDSSTKFKWA